MWTTRTMMATTMRTTTTATKTTATTIILVVTGVVVLCMIPALCVVRTVNTGSTILRPFLLNS